MIIIWGQDTYLYQGGLETTETSEWAAPADNPHFKGGSNYVGATNPHSVGVAYDGIFAMNPHDHGDFLIVTDSGTNFDLIINQDFFLEVNDGGSIFDTSPSNPHA